MRTRADNQTVIFLANQANHSRKVATKARSFQQGVLCDLAGTDGRQTGLYTALRAARVSKAELASRLHCHLPQVDRLLDLRHASRFDQLEAAFRALGKQLP